MISIRQYIDSMFHSSSAARFSPWIDMTTRIVHKTGKQLHPFIDPTFQNISPNTNMFIVFDTGYGFIGNLNMKPLLDVVFKGFTTDSTGLELAKFYVPQANQYYYTRKINLGSITFMI